jgi:hypothetical protein
MISSRPLLIVLQQARSKREPRSVPEVTYFLVVEDRSNVPMVAFGRQNEFQKVERRIDISLLAVDAGCASLLLHVIAFLRRKLLIRLAAIFLLRWF